MVTAVHAAAVALLSGDDSSGSGNLEKATLQHLSRRWVFVLKIEENKISNTSIGYALHN